MVTQSRKQFREIQSATHGRRRVYVGSVSAVADAPGSVIAPAIRGSARLESTGVETVDADGSESVAADDGRRIGDSVWRNGIVERSNPQLPLKIVAPTNQLVCRCKTANMYGPGVQYLERVATADGGGSRVI